MSERLQRCNRGKWVGGVCCGLASSLGVSPLPLRLAFVLWALSAATGAVVYFALWLLMPDQNTASQPLEQRIGRSLADMREQAARWYSDLSDALGANAAPDAQQMQRARLFGGVTAALGMLLLIDSLPLLGPLRLRQLEPVALILLGFVFVKRAL